MNALIKIFAVVVIVSVAVLAADVKREAWHTPIREYQDYDSVIFPVGDYALIQKIKIGMTFDEAKELTGFSPVNYYIHPDYALLATKVGEDIYEVAFLHQKGPQIKAISFRRIEMKKPEPNKAPVPTATAVTPAADAPAAPAAPAAHLSSEDIRR